jgi:hypothetical protein
MVAEFGSGPGDDVKPGTRCPCWEADVSRWPSRSWRDWSEAEREHVRLLAHGGVRVSHRPGAIHGPPVEAVS